MSRSPEALAVRARAGDELALRALAARYETVLRYHASCFFAPGLDRDDLYQEALIGLWRACHSYEPALQLCTFRSFLALCVRRHLISVVKSARREKRTPPSGQPTSLSLTLRSADGDSWTLGDELADPGHGPHDELVARDELRELVGFLTRELSPLELRSLQGWLNGDTYAAIEARLAATGDGLRAGRARFTPTKVVDNALTRVRRKAREFAQERAA